MLVCICHAKSERDIERSISEGASSVGQIGAHCGAGTDCGACIPDIEERLQAAGVASVSCTDNSVIAVSSLLKRVP